MMQLKLIRKWNNAKNIEWSKDVFLWSAQIREVGRKCQTSVNAQLWWNLSQSSLCIGHKKPRPMLLLRINLTNKKNCGGKWPRQKKRPHTYTQTANDPKYFLESNTQKFVGFSDLWDQLFLTGDVTSKKSPPENVRFILGERLTELSPTLESGSLD